MGPHSFSFAFFCVSKIQKHVYFEPSIRFTVRLNRHVSYDKFYNVEPVLHIFRISDDNIMSRNKPQKLVEQSKRDDGTSIRLSTSDVPAVKMKCSAHYF